MDITLYTQLKKLTVGDNCFAKLGIVGFQGMKTLESVTIGMNSFNGGDYDPGSVIHIKDCESLKELRIGRYSFSNYSHCIIENANSLEVLVIGDLYEESLNFQYGSLRLSRSMMMHH